MAGGALPSNQTVMSNSSAEIGSLDSAVSAGAQIDESNHSVGYSQMNQFGEGTDFAQDW